VTFKSCDSHPNVTVYVTVTCNRRIRRNRIHFWAKSLELYHNVEPTFRRHVLLHDNSVRRCKLATFWVRRLQFMSTFLLNRKIIVIIRIKEVYNCCFAGNFRPFSPSFPSSLDKAKKAKKQVRKSRNAKLTFFSSWWPWICSFSIKLVHFATSLTFNFNLQNNLAFVNFVVFEWKSRQVLWNVFLKLF